MWNPTIFSLKLNILRMYQLNSQLIEEYDSIISVFRYIKKQFEYSRKQMRLLHRKKNEFDELIIDMTRIYLVLTKLNCTCIQKPK